VVNKLSSPPFLAHWPRATNSGDFVPESQIKGQSTYENTLDDWQKAAFGSPHAIHLCRRARAAGILHPGGRCLNRIHAVELQF
jgi:hypothetical protein